MTFLGANCTCITPNGEEALCVPIEDCHLINLAVATGNVKAIEFSKMSECNLGGRKLVCCGTTGYPRNFDLVINPKNVLAFKPCVTPNGEQGSCVHTDSCHIIVDAVATGNLNAINFAKKSKCDSEDNMVCCGTTGYPRNFDVVINPKKVLIFSRFNTFEETNSIRNKDKNVANHEEEVAIKVIAEIFNEEKTIEQHLNILKENNTNSSCLTPNGEQAICVPAELCHVIVKAVAIGTTKALSFAKKSICPGGKNMICCGTTGYPRDFDIVINPQKVLLASKYLGLKELDILDNDSNFEIAPPKINDQDIDYLGIECITPNKELATCVPMESCHLMMLAVATGDQGAIEFARKSECASKKQKLICCGTTGYPRNFDIILNPKMWLLLKKYKQVKVVEDTSPKEETFPKEEKVQVVEPSSDGELQMGSTCFTPNGEKAKCIPIASCTLISTAISTGNETALAFAKESRCKSKEKDLVCCGTTGYSRPFHLKQNVFDFRFGGDFKSSLHVNSSSSNFTKS